MSAAFDLRSTGSGWAWTEAEIVRAKELRTEGFTAASIAGALSAEFGTQRTGNAVEKCLAKQRRPDHFRAADVARKVLVRKAEKVQLTVVPKATTRRRCLGPVCHGVLWFDSEGPGHRVCSDCKRSVIWS